MKKPLVKISVFLGTAIICGALQVTILENFMVFGVKPDLLLICACFASLIFEFRIALALSVFCGLFKDAFAVSSFGLNASLFALWTYLIYRLGKEIPLDHDYVRIGIVFIVALLHNIICGLIFIYSGESIPFGIFLRIVSIESIYTAIVMPLIFKTTEPLYS